MLNMNIYNFKQQRENEEQLSTYELKMATL